MQQAVQGGGVVGTHLNPAKLAGDIKDLLIQWEKKLRVAQLLSSCIASGIENSNSKEWVLVSIVDGSTAIRDLKALGAYNNIDEESAKNRWNFDTLLYLNSLFHLTCF